MDKRVALEMAVAGELTRLRLVERALYDVDASWAISLGGATFPAEVEIGPVGVVFTAEIGWGVDRPVSGCMSLVCDDIEVAVEPTPVEAAPGQFLTWAITLRTPALA